MCSENGVYIHQLALGCNGERQLLSNLNGDGILRLGRCSADEEPLVYRTVDLLGRQVLVGGEGRQLVWDDAARRVANGQVGAE